MHMRFDLYQDHNVTRGSSTGNEDWGVRMNGAEEEEWQD